MNAEIKKMWIEALRSVEYKQGQDWLRTAGNEYCCIGVLCDLHAKAVGGAWKEPGSARGFLYEGKRNWLPARVMEWAVLDEYDARTGPAFLISLNDSGLPFPEIANYIEKFL